MAELRACRACLATEVKFFNIYQNNLDKIFEQISGTPVHKQDGFPDFLCWYCRALVLKCQEFRSKCQVARDLMITAVVDTAELTTNYIKTIDRESNNLTTKLITKFENTNINPHTQIVKQETLKYEQDMILENIDIEYDDIDETKDEAAVDIEIDGIYAETENKQTQNDIPEHLLIDAKKLLENLKEQTIDSDNSDNVPLSKHERKNKRDKVLTLKSDPNIEVKMLTKQEQINEILARRNLDKYKNALFKCEICFKGYLSVKTYKNHMDMHSPSSGHFECDVCHTRWRTEKKLSVHRKSVHEKRYICRQCDAHHNSSHQAYEHQREHRGVMMNCKTCGRLFSKSSSLFTHIRKRHAGASVCEVCGEAFASETGLNSHRLRAHKDSKIKDQTHIKKYCSECKLVFKNNEALQKHYKTSSEHCEREDGKQYRYHCKVCGDSFYSDAILLEHLRVAHTRGRERVQCDECGQTFANSTTHALHFRTAHLGIAEVAGSKPVEKNYVCEYCGKKCSSNALLAYHQRSHTGERPYKCALCPKTFMFQQLWSVHQRTHTGERPYMCASCPKAFRSKAALNRHCRIHTGDKPYPCTYCGKSFSQSNSVKLHIRTVHLKLPTLPKRRKNDVKVDV